MSWSASPAGMRRPTPLIPRSASSLRALATLAVTTAVHALAALARFAALGAFTAFAATTALGPIPAFAVLTLFCVFATLAALGTPLAVGSLTAFRSRFGFAPVIGTGVAPFGHRDRSCHRDGKYQKWHQHRVGVDSVTQ